MQYDIDGGNITVVIGEEARMDVPTALNYIKSGQDEIEATVNAGIDAFDLNAANKTTDYNDNASAKVTAYNDNATAKTDAFDLNASNKTNDFNDNYTIKKGLIDASVDAAAGSASAASASADLAQQWAVKMDGKVADEDYSAKYYADLASQSAGATGANKDLSNLTAAGESRFTEKQDVISDLSTIRSGAALGDTSVQLSGAQTITGAKTFTAQPQFASGQGIRFNTDNENNEYYIMRSSGYPSVGVSMFLNNDTSKAAFNISPTKITIGSNTILPHSITPATSDSSTRIATTAYVKSNLSNYVGLTGNETIAGSKTFSSSVHIKRQAPRLEIYDENMTRGTTPTGADLWQGVSFYDGQSTAKVMGFVRQLLKGSNNTSPGENIVQMLVYKNSSSDNTAALTINYPASGNPYATAPASDVAGSIVTTVSKSKAKNGYFQLGNGLIIQWGSKAINGNTSATVTLPKAFTSTNYQIAVSRNTAAGATGDLKAAYVRGSKTTTGFELFSGSGNQETLWIAIGY